MKSRLNLAVKSYFNFSYLGVMDYHTALDLQRRTLQERQAEKTPDTLFFLQHPPVFTLGMRADFAHLLISEEEILKKGFSLVRSDRGGDITFHGPGQLMVYPIIQLRGHYRGVRRYIGLLEQTVILTLRSLGIAANTDPAFPGVWVRTRKIAAVGVRVRRRVAMHGLCLNVRIWHEGFRWIIPCGIQGRGVTSIHECRATVPKMEEIVREFIRHFSRLFAMKAVRQ